MIRNMYLCAFVFAAAPGLVLPASSVAQEKSASDKREVLTLGMNHVGLTVSDLDKSVAFFVETLDWREASSVPNL